MVISFVVVDGDDVSNPHIAKLQNVYGVIAEQFRFFKIIAMAKKIFQTLITILAFILFGNCEHRYHHSSILNNQTGQAVDLIITFNRAHIEEYWGWSKSYIPSLRQYGIHPGVELIKFDSINLIGYYSIQNNAAFYIDQGFGARVEKPYYPEFEIFKVIIRKDSIVINNQKDFEKYFIETEDVNAVWTLK